MQATEQVERRMMTVREAARYTGLGVRTIYGLMSRGELVPSRFGRAVRIDRADLDELIERGKRERLETR